MAAIGDHERRQHGARGRGRLAEHALDEERHEGDDAEHRHRGEADAGDARSDRRPAQELERNDRLAHSPLDDAERGEQHRRDARTRRAPAASPTRTRGRPSSARASARRCRRRAARRRGSRPSGAAAARGAASSARSPGARAGRPGTFTKKIQRQLVLSTITPPSAGPAIEPTANVDRDEPLPAAARPRRDDPPDRRVREREQPAGADALHGPEGDQLGHPPREPAEHRADEEDPDRDHEQRLRAVDVAELPVERER